MLVSTQPATGMVTGSSVPPLKQGAAFTSSIRWNKTLHRRISLTLWNPESQEDTAAKHGVKSEMATVTLHSDSALAE